MNYKFKPGDTLITWKGQIRKVLHTGFAAYCLIGLDKDEVTKEEILLPYLGNGYWSQYTSVEKFYDIYFVKQSLLEV